MPSSELPACEAFDPSAVAAVRQLRQRYPEAPFLTLGQTVLWDEPVKAAFCRILEAVAPNATMVAAVHDTDYFAKLGTVAGTDSEPRDSPLNTAATPAPIAAAPTPPPTAAPSGESFVMLAHNDGSTRGLWSAAGELSCLFGSETVPTRHALTQNGVAFDRVARLYPGGAKALLDETTEAWGWRALVHTGARQLIAADVKLRDIAPALRAQLQWGIDESRRFPQFATAAEGERTDEIARQVQAWIDEYIDFDEDGTLSDLYRALTPRLWSLVRGGGSCNLHSNTSMGLFRFNRATASLPRFKFVDLFLQPATRDAARRCYDEAVRGSGIYQLAQFGEGALPFDVVVRGRGRGTLRLHEGSLYIETPEPITLCRGCDCGSVQELAESLESMFGDGVALVGKAVALISMLAAEFIFVFHEKASSYTARTQVMNNCLRDAGVPLNLLPMLRLKYSTWSALAEVRATLRLPAHLAAAFGEPEVSAGRFAADWNAVCERQTQLLAELKKYSPRELMQYLAQPGAPDGPAWAARLSEYEAAKGEIAAARAAAEELAADSEATQASAREATARALQAEREKGEDWRRNVLPVQHRIGDLREAAAARLAAPGKPTREERAARAALEAEEEREVATLRQRMAQLCELRAHFDATIDAHRAAMRQARNAARQLTARRVCVERAERVIAARNTVLHLEYEAELQRLLRVRDALATVESLLYTNYRPTAWWFPLVSPDGTWFRALVRTTKARVEEL